MIEVWRSAEIDPPPDNILINLRRSEDGSLWWIEQTPKGIITSTDTGEHAKISDWYFITSEGE